MKSWPRIVAVKENRIAEDKEHLQFLLATEKQW